MPFPTTKAATPAHATPGPVTAAPNPVPAAPNIFTWVNETWTPAPNWISLPDTTQACAEGDQAPSTIGALKARFAAKPAAALPGRPAAPPGAARPATPPGAARPAAAAAGPARGRSPFAAVGVASIIRRNDYINPGCYALRIVQVKYITGRNGDHVVVEADVITSSYEDAKPETHGCNREGSRLSAFIKKNDNFDGNMKELMIALIGYDANGACRADDDLVTQEECEAAISDAQPYAGAVVYAEAKQITTKAGNPYTRVNWWPIKMLADGTPDYESIN
jgi:hypothetical protein